MTVSSYDGIAEWYDGWVEDPPDRDPYVLLLDELMGDVAGQRVCDLACGQGRVARHLAVQGAHVVGVDLSRNLLALARRRGALVPPAIAYHRADAQHLDAIADDSFDGVVCNVALMDIPELASTLLGVARLLRPGGWFVLSIVHPCYNTPRSDEIVGPDGPIRTVAGYFDEGFWRSTNKSGVRGQVGTYHRTLSTYLNALVEAGFVLERVSEARATGDLAVARPVWAEVPAILAARCRRAG